MSGKKRRDYKKVFQAVLRLMPSTNVEKFVLDFEAGLWQGLRDVFHEPQIQGCAFHFGQALWRKAQDLGLQSAYSNNDKVYKLMRKTFALPLLPHEDIEKTFDKLQSQNTDETLGQYFEYIKSTWINSDIWSPENWSVFGCSIRTNNDVEGWHARLNRRGTSRVTYPSTC
ncbi:uncharacterized protein LOC132720942 [Ruditapes philippinarum]|uniref:uncharacterized protein LOC132720942 n=1 Tax=Ruditapes philippinarum TaxID=129788 RepID=UPI00295BE49E|nr:uncharacterized protein LOC132720942 [Ruditapes philippinarum]